MMQRMSSLKCLFIVLCWMPMIVQAQTLFNYGPYAVSKATFLTAFQKNNQGVNATPQLYKDYLDLYIRFKLKVADALAKKMDTLPHQIAERSNFRDQLALNYMNDEASLQLLIDEVLERNRYDIHVQHIFIKAPRTVATAALKAAEAKVAMIQQKLSSGADFGALAATYSDDPVAKKTNGDLGYITTMVLPYDMENILYALPEGAVAKPYRSATGFHLFKNLGRRAAVGNVRIAQILWVFPPAMTPEQEQHLVAKADSVRRQLLKGADFASMAKMVSEDNRSYQNGGMLLPFGVGQYDPVFENAAFALQQNGEISPLIKTSTGIHILQRVERIPPATNATDPLLRDSLKLLIQNNDRIVVSSNKFLETIRTLTGMRILFTDAKQLELLSMPVLQGKKVIYTAPWTAASILIQYPKSTVKLTDWVKHLESLRDFSPLSGGKTLQDLFNEFVDNKTKSYYKDHLDEFNPAFAYQMQEFKEGNLLFEIMQKQVWDKAASDTVGLKKFFQLHKNKYWWEPSANAILFSCANDSVTQKTMLAMEQHPHQWQQFISSEEGWVQADSGRFELSQIPVVERTAFRAGLITAPVKNTMDGSSTFAYIVGHYPERAPRTFEDARGLLLNDYQLEIEEAWIRSLRKKYPVVIQQNVLKNLPK